jgi:formylglycine-generating enzyme required for sulfatase activity
LASPFLLSGRYGGAWTIPVDQLTPVRDLFIGLSGNVAEWCEDDYRAEMNSPELRSSFPRRVQADAATPGCKVVRGGSWMNGDRPEYLRTSTHWPELPEQRSDQIGFRLVIVEE